MIRKIFRRPNERNILFLFFLPKINFLCFLSMNHKNKMKKNTHFSFTIFFFFFFYIKSIYTGCRVNYRSNDERFQMCICITIKNIFYSSLNNFFFKFLFRTKQAEWKYKNGNYEKKYWLILAGRKEWMWILPESYTYISYMKIISVLLK